MKVSRKNSVSIFRPQDSIVTKNKDVRNVENFLFFPTTILFISNFLIKKSGPKPAPEIAGDAVGTARRRR